MGNKCSHLRKRTYKDARTKKVRRNWKKPALLAPETAAETTTTTTTTTAENLSITCGEDEPSAPETSTPIVPTASEKKINKAKQASVDSIDASACESSEGEEEEEDFSDDDINNVTDCDTPLGSPPCYVFMDTGILVPLLKELVKCPRCGYTVDCFVDTNQKQGLAQLFVMFCLSVSCKWEKTFYSSETIQSTARGLKPFDVNLRAIMAFREIGRGHQAMETFSGHMNMPPPMGEAVYNEVVKNKLHPVYRNVVTQNMKEAADEVREMSAEDFNEPEVYDTTVSCDGTWQRRGYSSLNGVFSVLSIDTGKCLAHECLVKTCKACEMWQQRQGTEQYDEFIKNHDCPINHEGSAPAMEAIGIVKIFERSVEDLKLRFTTYIGDGDSKAYPAVVNANPYGDSKPVEKGECIGHVQKRVGGRLRKYKKENSKKILKDGKKLGGIGRLNDKWINKLQNYYGLAIRQNTDSLHNMRKAVGAVLYHCSEASSTEARHMFCDKDSQWCKMRVAEKNGDNYTDKPGLPIAVRDEIKPIFQALSSETLLKKCLHGKTQNTNEALNGFIWKRLPKDVFIGRYTLEVGVASAVLSFNSGTEGLLLVYKGLGIVPGFFTKQYCGKRDTARIKNMKRKMSAKGIARRKKKRALRKGFDVVAEEREGEQYAPGMF